MALSGGDGSKRRSNTVVNSESGACGRVETGGSDVMSAMFARVVYRLLQSFEAGVDVLSVPFLKWLELQLRDGGDTKSLRKV